VRIGDDDYLLDRFDAGAGFHVLVFTDDANLTDDLERILIETGRQSFPVIRVLIGIRPNDADVRRAELVIADAAGRIAIMYGAKAGTVYVLRPDLHVCARWRETDAGEVSRALQNAACAATPEPAPEHAEDCPNHSRS
jgi:3-(3-hydroxy-phenyl)propionate hydroxylase